MPFTFIMSAAALLLHHQSNPISKKKTKVNIQIQRKPNITKEPKSN
jgi:hypothetical protein